MTATTTTDAQRAEIAKQAAYYEHPDCPANGLLSHRIYDARVWGGEHDDAVAVDFTYLHEDDTPGLETTIFAADGTVLDSQDFG